MSMFLINILLAFGWSAINGQFTVLNFFTGFIIGFACLGIVHSLYGNTRYFKWIWALLYLIGLFIYELVKSSLLVAKQVLMPMYCCPAIIAIPLEAKTDLEITLLANLITLTPGTLSVHVSQDRSLLFVHALFAGDIDELRKDIKEGFERHILEVTR